MLTLMALVFTVALTFSALEFPGLADSFIHDSMEFPALATGQDAETGYKTRLYMEHFHLREIGYAALLITLLLIIIGLTRSRSGLASAGAVLLFLPVFGQFAATMFFLGGLAFLRLLWLPFLDLSFDIMKLGDIALIPYRELLNLLSGIGIHLHGTLPMIITGIGLFIFLLGTLAWFFARSGGREVVDFWVYRFSRHPQYLGWMIWSYGILLLPANNQRRYFEISNTLPWVLSTLIIIGVALFEELKMKKIAGVEYRRFHRKTPFLFPLPAFISRFLKWPLRLFFHKKQFDRKREILVFLMIYLLLCMGLSAWNSGLLFSPPRGKTLTARDMNSSLEKIRGAHSRLVIREEIATLAGSGEAAIPSLLTLLEEKNPIIRWYTADRLSGYRSPAVNKALIGLLSDPDRWVRNAAAGALGEIGAAEAVSPLIKALEDPGRNLAGSAARALGTIGDPTAIAPLERTLLQAPSRSAAAAAAALAEMEARSSIPVLIQCLTERKDCPFHAVGEALFTLGSEHAVDAFRAGMKDPAWYIRIACLRGLEAVHSPGALEEIIDAIRDPEPKVRRSAVWCLRRFGFLHSSRVRTALGPMLKDPDFEVRLYVRDILRSIHDHDSHDTDD